MYEFFPQLEYCSENVLSNVLKSGIKDIDVPNKIYIHKTTCFDIWFEKCSYKGEYAYSNETCSQAPLCPRDCDSDNSLNKNMILTGFDVRQDLFIFGLDYFFNESASIGFEFLPSKNTDIAKGFGFPSLRFNDLQKFKVDVLLQNKETICQDVVFNVPLVSVKLMSTAKKSKWIPINVLIFDDLTSDDFVAFCVSIILYNDVVKPIEVGRDITYCNQPYYTGNKTIYPSNLIRVYGSAYSWCTNVDIFEDNFGVGIKY